MCSNIWEEIYFRAISQSFQPVRELRNRVKTLNSVIKAIYPIYHTITVVQLPLNNLIFAYIIPRSITCRCGCSEAAIPSSSSSSPCEPRARARGKSNLCWREFKRVLRGVRRHQQREALRDPRVQRMLRLLQEERQEEAHIQVIEYSIEPYLSPKHSVFARTPHLGIAGTLPTYK